MNRQKVIIDCDAGVDDCQGIMLALNQPDWEVVAITCVCGNTTLDNVWRNVLRVLKICGKSEVPVFKGATQGLLFTFKRYSYHGEDGLGDYSNKVDIDESLVQSEHATLALIRLVNQFAGDITIIALAPLTNFALSHRIDPSFNQKIKQLCIMGGNISGKGTCNLAAEFNFLCDPESSHIVLAEFSCPILIMPWETCISETSLLEWEWVDKWVSIDTPKGHFIKGITEKVITYDRTKRNQSGMHSCDLLATAAVLNPDIITEKISLYAQVELNGHFTRGQMVLDWKNILGKHNNVSIILKVDMSLFKSMAEKMLL